MTDPGGADTSNKIGARYKRAFLTGLATLLPTILTISVLIFCFNFVKDTIAGPVNDLMVTVLKTEWAQTWYWEKLLNRQPEWFLEKPAAGASAEEIAEFVAFSDRVQAHVPPWLGFVIALVLILLVGFIFKGYLGRQLLRFLEGMIQRLPVIKTIYPYAKQVTEFFFENKRPIQYESAVSVEYPRRGIWCIGFVTSEGFRDVQEATQEQVVNIFIPSSPTPFTGYTIMVPRDEVIPLNLTVDEALRFTISGGVLLPPNQLPPLALKTRKLEKPTT